MIEPRQKAQGSQRRARGWRAWREGEHGQSLVEFSLILPVFLLLLFTLVDFGRGYYTWLVVTNAAREGARAAAVQSDVAAIDAKVYGSFCGSWPSTADCALDTAKFHPTYTNVQGTRGSEASVSISYDFEFVTPIGNFLALVGGESISNPTIVSTSYMRLE